MNDRNNKPPQHIDYLDVAYRDLAHALIVLSLATSVLAIVQGALTIHYSVNFSGDCGGNRNCTCANNHQKDLAIATVSFAGFTVIIAAALFFRAVHLASIGLLNMS